jgi:hypothetical protein
MVKTKSKLCCRCKTEYPLSYDFFNKDNREPDGFNRLCKKCRKAYYEQRRDVESKEHKTYYSLNKSKIIARVRRYREQEDYREMERKTAKLYRESHKEEKREMDKQYRLENKEEIRLSYKQYREKNRELIKVKKAQYYQKNKPQINARHKHRLQSDVNCRITANLRSRLWDALKHQNAKKTNHTMDLVGCSIEFLKKYLEQMFLRGMTWDNYGRNGWSIDHIRPCALFDLTKEEEQGKCFHYKNLRPMWETDNFKKNSFYNGVLVRRPIVEKHTKARIKDVTPKAY